MYSETTKPQDTLLSCTQGPKGHIYIHIYACHGLNSTCIPGDTADSSVYLMHLSGNAKPMTGYYFQVHNINQLGKKQVCPAIESRSTWTVLRLDLLS